MYYVGDYEKCQTCRYFSIMGSTKYYLCSYADITGRSRIFKDGKKVIPKGYCDKYKEATEDIFRVWAGKERYE